MDSAAISNAWATGERLTLAAVAVGLFLSVLSTSIVSIALPAIGRGLGASASDLAWIVDAYVLVYASLLVAGGVMGDRRGHKGVFLLGVGAFGLGSLLCGAAPSVSVLLAARTLQGLGPALIIPGSLAIISATFEAPRRRAAAIGLWSMNSGLALALGPVLGGVIVDGFGWRWVFLANVPLVAALLLFAARVLPRLPPRATTGRFDWPGLILSTAGMALLTYAIIEGGALGWRSARILAAATAGGAALVLFVLLERRRVQPLVDVALFLRPGFAVANVAALVVFFSFVGAIIYLSLYFQGVEGRAPTEAGLAVSPIGIAYAVGAALSGRLVGRFGAQRPMLAGLLAGGFAMLGLLRLGPDTGLGAIWWDFALVGGAIGISLTPMTALAIAAVDAARTGMASAVHNAMRQLGQVLGVAVLGAIVYARLPARSAAAARLDPSEAARFVAGLHDALLLSGLALLAAALLAVWLLPPAGRITYRRQAS